MKTFWKWTALISAAAVGGTLAFQGIQAARRRMKQALGRAEAIADQTRQTIEDAETTLRSVRTSL